VIECDDAVFWAWYSPALANTWSYECWTWLVVTLIAGAVAVPFDFLSLGSGRRSGRAGRRKQWGAVGAVGSARIQHCPFRAGVCPALRPNLRTPCEAFETSCCKPAAARFLRRLDRPPLLADPAGLY